MSLNALNTAEIQQFLTAHSYETVLDESSLQIIKTRRRPILLFVPFAIFGLFFMLFAITNIAFLFIGLALMSFPLLRHVLTRPRPVFINTDHKRIQFYAGVFSKERHYQFSDLLNIELKDFIINSDANPFSDSTKEYVHTISLNFEDNRQEDLFQLTDRDYQSPEIIQKIIESLRGVFEGERASKEAS